MKKQISKLIAALVAVGVVALILSAYPVSAQQYEVTTAYNTNGLASGSNAAPGVVFVATKDNDLAVAVSAIGQAGTTNGNFVTVWLYSLDGTKYATEPQYVLSVAANGATRATAISNVTLGAIGYFKLVNVTNEAGALCTGTVYIAEKPTRRGN